MSLWIEGLWDADMEPIVPLDTMPRYVFLCMLRPSDKYPSGWAAPYVTPFDSSGLTMFLRTHALYHKKLAERTGEPLPAIRWFWQEISEPKVLPK